MDWLRRARDFLLGHFHDQEGPEDHTSENNNEAEYDERRSMAPFTKPDLEDFARDPTIRKKASRYRPATRFMAEALGHAPMAS